MKSSKCLQLSFVKNSIEKTVIEEFYPFGDLKNSKAEKFIIFVQSPSEYYYTDIFGSCLLTVDNAWKIYLDLLDQQDDLFDKKNLEILEKEIGDVEKTFKGFYNDCYTKFMKNNIIYY